MIFDLGKALYFIIASLETRVNGKLFGLFFIRYQTGDGKEFESPPFPGPISERPSPIDFNGGKRDLGKTIDACTTYTLPQAYEYGYPDDGYKDFGMITHAASYNASG